MQSPNPAKPHGKNDVDANRRRKYLINPAFQWKHAITLSLAVFLLSSILSCVLYSVLHEQARHRIMYPMSYSMDVGTVILFSAFGFSVLTAGAVGFCASSPPTVSVDPITWIAASRNWPPAACSSLRPLRKKDEFKELFATFARAVNAMKTQRLADAERISRMMDQLHAALNADDQASRRSLSGLAGELEQLKTSLSGWAPAGENKSVTETGRGWSDGNMHHGAPSEIM